MTASCVGLMTVGCRNAQPGAAVPPVASQRTVFTDSTLHAEQCEAPRAGQDWRQVCVPKDQSARPRPKP